MIQEIKEYDSDTCSEIGIRIQDIRESRHMKAIELASYLGIGKNQMSRIESGKANCTIPQLYGVQGGIRPGIVVSCDASNHGGAPQISVVPLSSKLKDNPVHVIVEPSEIRGYALSNRSDFMPEDIQTLNKGCVRFKSGYIPGESKIREAMDRAMIMQLNLLPVARKMVLEELEMKQNG